MRGHSLFSLVKASDAPAYRGNILLRMGGDDSRLSPVKAPPRYGGIDGVLSLKSCEILRRSELPRLSPPPGEIFSVNKRRIAPHRPRLSRGGGVGAIK